MTATDEVAIEIHDLGKRYTLGSNAGYRSLREALTDAAARPFRRSARSSREELWALRHVNLNVHKGEVIGIIGRNGSGKSTLLKLLSRITEPTEGWADIHGRVASLLEVGTGFHPELTGRENVYLNGAILGMTRAEIDEQFENIVEFSGVRDFLDTPVKRYSSGMSVRLAFAVAAHLQPEILIVDEVLSVGDIEFQRKCLGKMSDVASGGRTVLVVSHQMNQIRRLCDRVVWLDQGEVSVVDRTAPTVAAYEQASRRSERPESPDKASRKGAHFVRWFLEDHLGAEPSHSIERAGQPIQLSIELVASKRFDAAMHGIALYDADGQLVWGTSQWNLPISQGRSLLTYRIQDLPIAPGAYRLFVTLYDGGELVESWHCEPDMLVATVPTSHAADSWTGILNLDYEMSVVEVKQPAPLSP